MLFKKCVVSFLIRKLNMRKNISLSGKLRFWDYSKIWLIFWAWSYRRGRNFANVRFFSASAPAEILCVTIRKQRKLYISFKKLTIKVISKKCYFAYARINNGNLLQKPASATLEKGTIPFVRAKLLLTWRLEFWLEFWLDSWCRSIFEGYLSFDLLTSFWWPSIKNCRDSVTLQGRAFDPLKSKGRDKFWADFELILFKMILAQSGVRFYFKVNEVHLRYPNFPKGMICRKYEQRFNLGWMARPI